MTSAPPGTVDAVSSHAHTTQRGRELERVVAGLFSSHGYTVTLNRLCDGRSGARHEVDVLAHRGDGLLTTAVGVECKHWAAPVDVEVVARASLMRDDLGLSEVVVVCPGGAGPAARHAAADRGVRLWDADALRQRLGDAALTALAGLTAFAPGDGVARAVGGERAELALRSRARGPLGALAERIRWVRDAWLPVHELTLDVAMPTGRRGRLTSTRRWTTFDALTGRALWEAREPLDTAQVDVADGLLDVLVPVGAVADRLARNVERLADLRQPAARARAAEALTADLLPEGVTRLTVASRRTLAWPVTVGLLDRGGTLRAVVLDGTTGRVDAEMGERLTECLGAVTRRLEPGSAGFGQEGVPV